MVKCISSTICCVIAFVALFRAADSMVGWFLSLLNLGNSGFMVRIFHFKFNRLFTE